MATSTQQFTTDGSWVCPIGVTSVTVAARGAGGGGGGLASNTDNQSSAGGAGGQYAVKVCAVTAGTSYAIDIGAAGTAGANTGGNGGTGADTTFATDVVVAKGGDGGHSFENSYTGGVGSATGGVGDTVRAGGSGGAGGAWNGSGGGGEGGNSDKVGEDGGVGSAGVAGAAGGAGAGGGDGGNGAVGKTNASGVAGGAGTAPGGGGSGAVVGTSDTNRAGGAGAIGRVDLSWTTPLISALTDNFNDNSIDGAKWVINDGSGDLWTEANNELENTTKTAGNDDYIFSGLYDLSSSQATCKLVDAGNQSLASLVVSFKCTDSGFTGYLFWKITGGNIIAGYGDWGGGGGYSASYVAATFKYLRIRESGGTSYCDSSADGITWTNRYSVANTTIGVSPTSLQFGFEVLTTAEASTTTAKVENFNIIPTAALTGTVTTATETDIVNGGKTIILTLTNDTWIAAGAASFDLQRQNIINGLTSAQSETYGWNLVPKATQSVTGVVRTSDTVVTITLDAFATYNITATETITATIPATALTGAVAIVAAPTFNITASAGGATGFLTTNKGFWG
jgi:hypothetical protein